MAEYEGKVKATKELMIRKRDLEVLNEGENGSKVLKRIGKGNEQEQNCCSQS